MKYDNSINLKNLTIIAFALFLGALMVGNAFVIERSMNGIFFGSFIEEVLKFSVVLLLFFTFRKQTSPFILAIAVAVGFAIVENLLFGSLRIPFALLHIVAALVSAAGLAKCERDGWHKVAWVIPSFLILASLFHASFNILASTFGRLWTFTGWM